MKDPAHADRPSTVAVSEILRKTLPHNHEAEVAVLGGILLDQDALDRATEYLKAEHFSHEPHQRIFEAMVSLSERGAQIDEITVSAHLEDDGRLDAIGGRTFITSLAEQAVSSANVSQYAELIAEKAMLRQMIRLTADISAEGYEVPPGQAKDYINKSEHRVLEISRDQISRDFYPMRQVALESQEVLAEQRKAFEEGRLLGVPTGYRKLDDMTMGLQPAELIILAARPAMGKTSFALNLAEYVGVEEQRTVAFFSLEMSRQQLGMRMLCSRARINQRDVRKNFSQDPWPTLNKAAEKLYEAKIFIDDSMGVDLYEIRSKARRLKSEHNLSILIIDYLQLIQPSTKRRSESREREVAEISRGLKHMAKELEIPIIVLAQLNRQVESTADKVPSLAHLRESGALEQDADLVLFLYRKEHYFPQDLDCLNKADVIIAKNRNGPTGSVPLAFFKELTRFDNLAENDPYRPSPPKTPGRIVMPDAEDVPPGDDNVPY